MTKLLMDATSTLRLSRSLDAVKPGCANEAEAPASPLFSVNSADVSAADVSTDVTSTCGWAQAAGHVESPTVGRPEAEPDAMEHRWCANSEPLDSRHVASLPSEYESVESPTSEPGRYRAGYSLEHVVQSAGMQEPAGAGACMALEGWYTGADCRDGGGAQAVVEHERTDAGMQEFQGAFSALADPTSGHNSSCHSPWNYARGELCVEHVGLSEDRKRLRRRLSFEDEALGPAEQQQGAEMLGTCPGQPVTGWQTGDCAVATPAHCEALAADGRSAARLGGYTTGVPMCVSTSVEQIDDEFAIGSEAQGVSDEQVRYSVLIRGPLGSLFVGTEGSKRKLRQGQKASSALDRDAGLGADGQPPADGPCIPALASHESAHSWTAAPDEGSEMEDQFVFEPYLENDGEKGSSDELIGIHIVLPPPPPSPEPTPEDMRAVAPLFDPQRIASFKRKKGIFICLLLLGSALYAISFIVGILVASGYTGNASPGLDMLSQAMLASSNTWVAMANLVLYLSMDLIGLTGALLEYSPVLSLYIAVEIIITTVSALEALRPLLIYRLIIIFCAYLLRYECLELMEAERHLRNRLMGTPLPPPNTNTILAKIRFFPGTLMDMRDHTIFLYQHPFTVLRGWTFHRFRRRTVSLSWYM